MQPQENVSITRRPLDVEDYIDVLRRHKSWIFGPTFLALVAATVVAFLWPDTFLSTGTIRVVPPQVPEMYVNSNLNNDLQGRFNSMIEGILNRTTLQSIISEFDLYKKDLRRMPLEDVIDNMRLHDVVIEPVQGVGQVNGRSQVAAFHIGFKYNNRLVAQKVAQKLIADIMLENQKETSDVSKETSQFLRQSWDAARDKLNEFENKLSTFRQNNLGKLPEQQQSNFNQMTAIQTQLLNLNTSMGRVTQEKLVLESQQRAYKDQLTQLKDPSASEQAAQQTNEKLQEKDREIAALDTLLTSVRERYKENFPDVQNLVAKLAAAKKQREDILKEEANKKPETVVARPANPMYLAKQSDLNSAIKRLQAYMDAKDLEMQDYRKQSDQFTAQLKEVQGRLAGMPVGLKEYDALARDRDLAKAEYERLDKSLNNSDLATRVIQNRQGERLELTEDASIPQTPTEPKRPVIILAGTGLGLILGLFLAGAREVKDTSLKNLKDVRAYTQLPILGSIPLLENDLIVRRRRRITWLAWATACLVGLVVMSSSVVYYYATKL
jgi:succinoglycan biosynthesis transport protein ExoP